MAYDSSCCSSRNTKGRWFTQVHKAISPWDTDTAFTPRHTQDPAIRAHCKLMHLRQGEQRVILWNHARLWTDGIMESSVSHHHHITSTGIFGWEDSELTYIMDISSFSHLAMAPHHYYLVHLDLLLGEKLLWHMYTEERFFLFKKGWVHKEVCAHPTELTKISLCSPEILKSELHYPIRKEHPIFMRASLGKASSLDLVLIFQLHWVQ